MPSAGRAAINGCNECNGMLEATALHKALISPPQHAQCVFTKQLMETADGAPSSLKGRANGAIIEMTFDADRGSVFMLSFQRVTTSLKKQQKTAL